MSAQGPEHLASEGLRAAKNVPAVADPADLVKDRDSRNAFRRLVVALTLLLLIIVASAWRYIRVRTNQAEESTRQVLIDREIEDALADAQGRMAEIASGHDPEQAAFALAELHVVIDHIEVRAQDSLVSQERRADIARFRDNLNRKCRDLTAIADIDRVRLDSINSWERRIAPTTLALRYSKAFALIGIEPSAEQASACSNAVRIHLHRERLLAGLSAWAILESDGRKRSALRQMMTMVESRDMYRPRLRDALFRKDDALVARLLKSPELAKQPPIYLCRLSVLMRNLNRENQALEVLQLGVSRHPGDFWLNAELGGLWLQRKGEGLRTARRYFNAAVAIRPKCAGANYLLGVASQKLGDVSEASNALVRAIEHDDAFSDAHLCLSIVLQSQNDLNGAIEHGRKASELSPTNPMPANQLAVLHQVQGNVADAVQEYRRALAIDSHYLPALLGLGELLRDVGNLDEAELVLKKAVDESPDLATAMNQYGLALQARGDFNGAVRLFQKAKDAQPPNPLACVYLGAARQAQGHREEALRWYQAALDRDPKCAEAFVQFGLDHLARGEMPEAQSRFQKAIDCDSNLASPHFFSGWAHMLSRETEKSFKAFARSAELKPHWIEAQFLTGASALESGMLEEAAKALGTAAQMCRIDHPLFGPVHILLERAKRKAAARFEVHWQLQGSLPPLAGSSVL